MVDGNRLTITGGSAGGYATLFLHLLRVRPYN
jgi:dipeptidyl aminopeptidase/acylaminoacyl peptidase